MTGVRRVAAADRDRYKVPRRIVRLRCAGHSGSGRWQSEWKGEYEGAMAGQTREGIPERSAVGVVAGVIAWLVIDYVWWEVVPIEARTVGEFLAGTWFAPSAAGIAAFAMGLWRGSEALDFAVSIWKSIW